jgi:predicted GNAT superfamily acetyltransferase
MFGGIYLEALYRTNERVGNARTDDRRWSGRHPETQQRHSIELSWLDSQRFDQILRWAYHARMVLDGSAFLIAFAADSGYDGANFLWFKSRYKQFIYIDRVAVAQQQRGRGIARSLYADLFDRAFADGYSVVTCEVNISPPNLASLTFHGDLGFRAVGEARTPTGKVVQYLARQLSVGSGKGRPD